MFKIRYYKSSDTKNILILMSKTFRSFNYTHGTKMGVKKFLETIEPNQKNIDYYSDRFKQYPFLFVVTKQNKLIGFLRGSEKRLISLFVEGKYHRQGIGTSLMKKFETCAKKIGSKKIKIRASLYGLPFYSKLGYKKSTSKRTFKGLFIQPMKKDLN